MFFNIAEVPQDSLKISIPKELKQKFKAYAAFADKDMSQIAVELIQKWVTLQESDRANTSGDKVQS